MRITSIKAVPISYRVPEGQNVRLGIGRAVKRDAVLVKVETDEGLVGWGEAHHGRCPGAIAKLIDTTISRTRGRHGCDERGRRLAARLPDAAREPRHGLCRRDGAERSRPGAVGHPRQGGGLAAVQTARRRLEADQGLCRRHLARLAGAGIAGGGSARLRRARLPGDQAARRRQSARRRRPRHRGARGGRRRHRNPGRRQHRLHGRRRAPRDAGLRRTAGSAGSKSRSRRRIIVPTRPPRRSAPRRWRPAKTTSPASSSPA